MAYFFKAEVAELL